MTLIVKNIYISLTYTVASSYVCTSPLAVMTIVGRHDFVKESISASYKSFSLIICIDAPESTTNSRSSRLRFDAAKHQFSQGEKNVALFSFFFSKNFGQLPRYFEGTLLLPLLSPPETDPQILEHWGCADEVLLGKIIPSEGFWSRILA